ncbi:hypothetical protein ECH_0228 [Ehrlichia chaffeensis str. Arkansas]|uniref:Uncharacterized protein n=1 Tax=Ehrlichia chaffeensis (strain ATCC CRL-10679 / Arkansas) TaxID=205920 RepID=Q2GHN4_EHRCR|nr:hypothetical protein ECH_0228 [Ehrlichia chaffeensis str. Arkansas]
MQVKIPKSLIPYKVSNNKLTFYKTYADHYLK